VNRSVKNSRYVKKTNLSKLLLIKNSDSKLIIDYSQIAKRDLDLYGTNWCTACIVFNLSTICCHWNLMWTELASGGQIDFIYEIVRVYIEK